MDSEQVIKIEDSQTVSAIMVRITEGKNPRGIPTAKFIVSLRYLERLPVFQELMPNIS